MPSIKFLDGSTKNFPDNVTGIEIAKSISPSLSKDAIAIVIDGIQKDFVEAALERTKHQIIYIFIIL